MKIDFESSRNRSRLDQMVEAVSIRPSKWFHQPEKMEGKCRYPKIGLIILPENNRMISIWRRNRGKRRNGRGGEGGEGGGGRRGRETVAPGQVIDIVVFPVIWNKNFTANKFLLPPPPPPPPPLPPLDCIWKRKWINAEADNWIDDPNETNGPVEDTQTHRKCDHGEEEGSKQQTRQIKCLVIHLFDCVWFSSSLPPPPPPPPHAPSTS